MARFQWSEDLRLNVTDMDNEHQELIGYMNALADKVDGGAPKEEVLTAYEALANFTVKHFEDEEAYMASKNFEGIGIHKTIHKQLLDKVNEFYEGYKSGSIELGNQFFDFLKMWLISHIKGIDKKYTEI